MYTYNMHNVLYNITIIETEINARRKLLPISPPALIGELYIPQLFFNFFVLAVFEHMGVH